MSANARLAEQLELMSKLMDLTGADSFRSSAHARAARTIADASDDIPAMALSGGKAALTQIQGIGDKLADKIIEFARSGSIKELRELQNDVPAGLLEIMQVPGLGPKTVRVFWQEAGVTDMAGLKKIIDDGSILTLPRMGEKAVEKIKASIALHEASGGRLRIGPAMMIAHRVVDRMRKVKGVHRAEFAGSLRRGKETIGDIDVLVACDTPAAIEAATEAFVTMPGIVQVIARGETRSSVQMNVDFASRWEASVEGDDAAVKEAAKADTPAGSKPRTIQVDLRVLPAASFGAALMYFTGSKEHNILLRQRALDRGMRLNDYGLFPDDGQDAPHTRGVKPIVSKTEEEIFKALGLRWVPPELREARGEVEAFALEPAGAAAADTKPAKPERGASKSKGGKGAETKKSKGGKSAAMTAPAEPRAEVRTAPPMRIEDLVTIESIKAELHAHTTASDGVLSVVELAEAAKARGFHTLAVTDHSKSSVIANGLTPDRLRKHIDAIHAAREKVKGITLLAGSEVDILSDGSLDYDDDLLAKLDVVVASPHAALGQDAATATKRLLKAIRHPLVHILGHPTGRLILRRPGLEPDMNELIAAAKEHDVALEINAHWMRLDLRDTHVRAAADAGCVLAIDCDVHEPEDFDNLVYGVMTARRGWLRKEQCVNAWDAPRLKKWLEAKR